MFLSFFFFFCGLALITQVKVEGCQQPKNVFLLAGQSNMSGRGGNHNDTNNIVKWNGKIPPECASNKNILRLNANETWEEAHEPLHNDIDYLKTCGIGPGMPFANAILAAKDPSLRSIGLVPCAIGGTRIIEWSRGTRLYRRLVDRAKASLTCGGKIRALLWYQGESDTSRHDSKLYKVRLEKFFNDLRHDLNHPNLPIIMVGICSADQGPFMNRIRIVQLNYNDTNVKAVDAMGSTFIADQKHLDTKSQIRVGQKLAAAFLSSFAHPH
ncbi:probable carbohydrate esterase At4g34215 [Corylus avellana]|uniref:probable carbohydrate esterase At4g34215 n=1 Tax=Corylus avellana TaxID=13451 RepID=UPI001E1EBFE9|nr:probable carbohydrate esterase At4g34215 [Corylus avellana]